MHNTMARIVLETNSSGDVSLGKGISSTVTMNLLAQNCWSNYFFYICYRAGGSTKHLRRSKVKRRDEESPPCDTSTPKKGKTRLAGKMRTYL